MCFFTLSPVGAHVHGDILDQPSPPHPFIFTAALVREPEHGRGRNRIGTTEKDHSGKGTRFKKRRNAAARYITVADTPSLNCIGKYVGTHTPTSHSCPSWIRERYHPLPVGDWQFLADGYLIGVPFPPPPPSQEHRGRPVDPQLDGWTCKVNVCSCGCGCGYRGIPTDHRYHVARSARPG